MVSSLDLYEVSRRIVKAMEEDERLFLLLKDASDKDIAKHFVMRMINDKLEKFDIQGDHSEICQRENYIRHDVITLLANRNDLFYRLYKTDEYDPKDPLRLRLGAINIKKPFKDDGDLSKPYFDISLNQYLLALHSIVEGNRYEEVNSLNVETWLNKAFDINVGELVDEPFDEFSIDDIVANENSFESWQKVVVAMIKSFRVIEDDGEFELLGKDVVVDRHDVQWLNYTVETFLISAVECFMDCEMFEINSWREFTEFLNAGRLYRPKWASFE